MRVTPSRLLLIGGITGTIVFQSLRLHHGSSVDPLVAASAPAPHPEITVAEPAAHSPASAATTARPSVRSSDPSTSANAMDELLLERLLSDPTLQVLHLEALRLNLEHRYAPFLRDRSCLADVTAALYALILQREEQRLDLADLIRGDGRGTRDRAAGRLMAALDEAFSAALAQLLGREEAAAFIDFERLLPAWDLVATYAGAMTLQGEPLSPPQATAVVASVANSSPEYRAGGTINLDTVDWPAAIETAAPALSPPQLAQFRNFAPTYPIEVPSD